MKLKFPNEKHEEFKKVMNIKDKQNEVEKTYFKRATKYIKFIKWIP
jgi:hypothetical protein